VLLSSAVAACGVEPNDGAERVIAHDVATGETRADSPVGTPTEGVGVYAGWTPDGATIKPDTVFGNDGRQQVTPTLAFPASARVRVAAFFSDGHEGQGTGYMVGNKYLLTAGHVVFSPDHGGFTTSLVAFPAEDGDTKPFGKATGVVFRTSKAWHDSQDECSDYALVTLDAQFGDITGWYGLQTLNDGILDNDPNVTIGGYPTDKPFGTQWQETGPIVDHSDTCLYYNVDTTGGDSGAGVVPDDGKHEVAAVHDGTDFYNYATRITSARFDLILGWIQSGT